MAKGITYKSKHYTGYEATQKQRQLECAQRVQKNRIFISRSTGDTLREQTAQIRLQILSQHYKAFSKAAGLPLQQERTWVAGFRPKQAKEASAAANTHHKAWLKSIGAENSELNTIEKYAEGKYNNSPDYQLLNGYRMQ